MGQRAQWRNGEVQGRGVGEILLEAQDVAHLGATPAIDALVVVADAAEILLARRASLRDQAQPEILRDIGVLIFVDKDVFEPRVIFGEHIRMFAKQS